ncbi:MAG TPA: hypothetical protein VIY48_21785 [Candidatus Paceibacterota bacterium]
MPTVIKDTNITLKNILQALDHNLTFADNMVGGQGAAINNIGGTLGEATTAINAILAELRRQGIIAS